MSEAEKTDSGLEKSGRCEQKTLFEFSFNHAVKVRCRTQTVSANTGALLLRETEDRLGIVNEIASRLRDPRDQRYVRHAMDELLRGALFANALGFSRQDDADVLAHDPAFKTAVWNRAGSEVADERLASQPTISRLVSLISGKENLEILRQSLHLPLLRHKQADGGEARFRLGVVDIDGFSITTYGDQPGAELNGYYNAKVYSPLAAYFSANGDFKSRRLGEGFIDAKLRPGNASPAGEAIACIDRVIVKAKELAQTVTFRMDAGFAGSEVLNHINQSGCRFTVRLPANAILQDLARPFPVRPNGRPPKGGYEDAIEFTQYMNQRWDKPYRVILVVSDKPVRGLLTLQPDYFFLRANWTKDSRSPQECLDHYRQRGTFEDRIGEWKGMGVNLSLDTFDKNEATLLLSFLAYNLNEILRSETESAIDPRPNPPYAPEDSGWDMGRLRDVVLKAGSVLARGGRRLWFDLADGVAPFWQALLDRIKRWNPIPRKSAPRRIGFIPPVPHAFMSLNLRF